MFRSKLPHRRARRLLLLCVALASCVPGRGQALPSLAVQPGASAQRTFGAATVWIHVAEARAEVDVAVELDGRTVVERTLAPSDNVLTLNQRMAETSIRGSLIASFGYPQQTSILAGEFVVTLFRGGSKGAVEEAVATPYHADLATWRWSVPVVREHWLIWITPELSADVNLLLDPKQSLEIRLGTVSQVILAATVAEGSNDVLYTVGYAVATVTIASGLHFHLQPSTPVQRGVLSMQGTFSSSGHPEVKYDGGLVNWAYVAPPLERESTP